MTKKRVHEIAKEQGLSSKELLQKLKAAGVEAKAAASSVDEAAVLKALSGNGAAARSTAPAEVESAPAPEPPPAAPAEPPATQGAEGESGSQPAAERVRPTRDS